MRTYLLWLSASALALNWGAAAYAQTKDKGDNQMLETVVVTGERRTENLATTSVSATVLSGNDLEKKNIVTIDQLQFSAPATVINNFGQGINFNIRGIGKGEHNTQTLTGVITYRDGVATFPGYFTQEPYYDIAGIEILRGPQGTFVGQNATGGAVFVRTNDPEIGGDYNGYVLAQYANYYDMHLQGAVNIPISDTFAMRVAVFGDARSSFFSIKDTNPEDACPGQKYAGCKPGYNPGDVRWAAGRISALWKPNDRFTLSFKYDADYLDSGAYPAGSYKANNEDLFHINADGKQFALDRFTRAVLSMSYEFENGITVKSVSGFQNGNTNWGTDLDGTSTVSYTAVPSYTPPLPTPTTYFPITGTPPQGFWDHVDETIWSQEINVISPDSDRFNWIFGLFAQSDIYDFPKNKFVGDGCVTTAEYCPYTYSYYDAFYGYALNTIRVPHYGYQWTLYGQNPQTSYAVFGQVGYKLLPNVEVKLGGRYSINRSTNSVTFETSGISASQSGANGDYAKSDNFSYKASLEWSVNDSNFLYGFVATGYKPGGLNPPLQAVAWVFDTSTTPWTYGPQVTAYYSPTPFKEETVRSYEVGWKTTMLDGHLRGAIDAYYNSYKNFIVTMYWPEHPSLATEINAPTPVISTGIEAELEGWIGNFRFNLGVGAMHQKLGDFYAAAYGSTGGVCDPANGPGTTTCINLKGNQLPYAPLFTANAGVEYEFHLDGGDTVTPRLSYAHQSPQWATVFNDPAAGQRVEARDLFNGQIEWKHGTYVFTLYSTNLTDQHYKAALINPLVMPGAPRQYGIRLLKVF